MIDWLAALALVSLQQGHTLSGTVSGPDGPLAGATVLVPTAKPRHGVAVLCPSCYLDCKKRTVTDAEGRFAIEDLDRSLLFRVLVYAPGHLPRYSDGMVDPAHGPFEVELEPRDLDALPPERVARGRVVGPDGEPVAHAAVELHGGDVRGGTMFGLVPGVDTLAISDAKGEFALASSSPGTRVLVRVEARSFAPRFAWIRFGVEPEPLVLDRGVTVQGVVRKDGKPLAGVELGLAQQDRRAERYLGDLRVGTDEKGAFGFFNVPANDACELYGIMASLAPHGALASRVIRTGEAESTLDAGALDVGPAHRIRGRLELADGASRPAGLRVLLSREAAWDSLVAEVAEDGSFAFEGVPPEVFTLNSRVPGFVMSPRNASYDFVNHEGLLGVVDADVSDLVLLFEPGEVDYDVDVDAETFRRYEALRATPLRGAPPENR